MSGRVIPMDAQLAIDNHRRRREARLRAELRVELASIGAGRLDRIGPARRLCRELGLDLDQEIGAQMDIDQAAAELARLRQELAECKQARHWLNEQLLAVRADLQAAQAQLRELQ